MVKTFKVGDHVTWNSEAGHVSGRILRGRVTPVTLSQGEELGASLIKQSPRRDRRVRARPVPRRPRCDRAHSHAAGLHCVGP